jgi:hypothetical protein
MMAVSLKSNSNSDSYENPAISYVGPTSAYAGPGQGAKVGLSGANLLAQT